MDLIEAINKRHAVRHYDGMPIKQEHKEKLNEFIKQMNNESKLNMQLVVFEPKAFNGGKAARCNFTGCVNYLAIVGPKSKSLKEKAGYYGEKVVLKAQQLGLNSCWVLLTFNKVKGAYQVAKDEKLVCVIALGYGTTQGKPHNSKMFAQVCKDRSKLPDWFIKGVELALLAPTGVNQQGFKFKLLKNNVVKLTNHSLCNKIDVGILKYHFELGAGHNKFTWYK